MFDSTIAKVFKELKMHSLLNRSNIQKRCGVSVDKVVYDLFHVPFLMFTTVFLFVRNQFEEAVSKNVFYRFLENANYNWHLFSLNLSYQVDKNMGAESNHTTEKFFVLDDTITKVSGKLIESASYIFDHTIGRSVLGFQKLVLGIYTSDRFIPVGQRICVSKKRPDKKSKAGKYTKTPKSDKINPESAGAKEREELEKNKLEKSYSLLKEAKKKIKDVHYVLFDSWFCFNCFIKQVKSLGIEIICQLKNMPRTNKYSYNGKEYSLKELYNYFAKPKMRTVKEFCYKRALLTVNIPGEEIQLKIAFIQNEGENKWHAFSSTDTKLSADKILGYYSKRWSIEVFFKNCKQYLNFGKEQMSNLDSIIASDALVFLRYSILTYLSFKENHRFYEVLEKNRDNRKTITYGLRLLKYFLNKLKYIIDVVCNLIQENKNDEAIDILRKLTFDGQEFQLKCVDLK
jgi:DDE superfamily endonuclease